LAVIKALQLLREPGPMSEVGTSAPPWDLQVMSAFVSESEAKFLRTLVSRHYAVSE
jgi:hypothetical protein